MARLQLLFVDSDARSLRVTGAGLSRHGFTVTPASGAEEALGKLRAQSVDVVLCSAALGEGLAALRRQMLAEETLASVPVVVLAEPGGWIPSGGWAGLAVADVVSRPVVTGDLVSRVRGAVESGARTGDFQSSLDRMSALDLVEHFRAGRLSGTATFTGRREGSLQFHAGAPVDAALGLHSGREAFFRLLASRDGDFEVRMGPTAAEGNLAGDDRALLEEALAWVESWDVALEQVPPLSAVLEQDAVKVAARQASLPEEAGWLLRLVDGERTVEDLVEASTLGGVAALEILARLYFEGLVSVRARAPEPVRRPRVEEWLNTPPAVVVPGAPSASGPSTQTLSREEFAALGESLPASEAVQPAGAAEHPEPSVATPTMTPASAGPATQTLTRDELEALETVAPVARGPATLALSREELEAFEAAPPVSAPARSPSAPEPEVALPSGFMDEEGFPMGVPLVVPPTRRAAPHGRRETPAATEAMAAPAAVAAMPEVAEPPSSPGATSGWVPFERAAVPAPVAPVPETVDPAAPSEAPPPVAAPESVVEPEQAQSPDVPSPAAAPTAPAPTSESTADEDDDVAAMLKPSRSRWVLGGLAAAGLALVGLGAYFGLRPSGAPPAKQEVAPAAVAAVPSEANAEPDAGSAVAEAAEAVAADAPDADGGAVPAEPVAQAPSTVSPEAAAPPAPAVVAPVAEAAPPSSPTPLPAAAPASPAVPPAVSPPASPQPLAASAPAAQAQGPVVAARPATQPASPVRPADPPPTPQAVDIRAAKTPPPQGATVQDRVAPGLLPRKASPMAPAAGEGASAASAKAANTAAAVHVRGAKQAMQYGLWKLAADSFRKAMALGADTPDVKAGLGICLVSADSGIRGYQEAVIVLRQALAQDEGNARAWLSLGMAYQFLGNNPEAVVAYKRYLVLQPNGKNSAEVRALLERL